MSHRRHLEIKISIHALREEGDIRSLGRTEEAAIFLSTPSARRATEDLKMLAQKSIISIHALREEGDGHPYHKQPYKTDFYPRPPRGGRPWVSTTTPTPPAFLSTPSARRATTPARAVCRASLISIHALREEGDQKSFSKPAATAKFLSTPSARRATPWSEVLEIVNTDFYPRPPRGGRRSKALSSDARTPFLSTPSARRATTIACILGSNALFLSTPSARRATRVQKRPTHAPQEFLSTPSARRATQHPCWCIPERREFLSTPSARRATQRQHRKRLCRRISIHALREEGDTLTISIPAGAYQFLSTPSARRATPLLLPHCLQTRHFYPRPPRGGRQQKQRKQSPLLYDYKAFCMNLKEKYFVQNAGQGKIEKNNP